MVLVHSFRRISALHNEEELWQSSWQQEHVIDTDLSHLGGPGSTEGPEAEVGIALKRPAPSNLLLFYRLGPMF